MEGGNGVNDLPGTNDGDPLCQLVTKDGVDEAGVIMVLLKRDLQSAAGLAETLSEHVAKRALTDDSTRQRVIFLFNREGSIVASSRWMCGSL